MSWLPLLIGLAGTSLAWTALREARRRGLDRWLVPYCKQAPRRWAVRPEGEVHLLLCIADHFEPFVGHASPTQAWARVEHWVRRYPEQFGNFRDSDGRPPQHTFFYPLEDYTPAHLEALASLCRRGFGEVEVHLHHEGDTAESLRDKLLTYKEILNREHGLLARDRQSGEVAYGFIHGNWALDNARPDGRWCGVSNELEVLRSTGCYADFTLPSAPSPTQTRKINSLYYAVGQPGRCRSHDDGRDVGSGPVPSRGLLLIQGPLVLDWGRRKWGWLPRMENGCLQASQPPHRERLGLWLGARIQVPSRPDWYFVKLYTHGATEANQLVLLGEPMRRFHEDLARWTVENPRFHFHYVTAREMANLVKAAEAGWQGSVAGARDFALLWNGGRAAVPSDGCAAVLAGGR